MNWYVEKNGISEGPLTEQELAMRIRTTDLSAETLIWHVGLDEWKSIRELKPEWVKPVVVEKPKPAEPTPPTATKSVASAKTAEPEEKPGLFKRLFGRKK